MLILDCYATSWLLSDGWMSTGEVSFCTDPIISAGMNYGVATAYSAMQATLYALNTNDGTTHGLRVGV